MRSMRWILTSLPLLLALLILASPALAHRRARTVVDEGHPITVWLTEGKKTFVSFPQPILGFDAPIAADQVALKVVEGYDSTLVLRALDLKAPVMMSIPTVSGVHIIHFKPHPNSGDTYVTIVLPGDSEDKSKAELKPNHYAQMADEAPMMNGMARLWYAMYAQDGAGVEREKAQIVLSDQPEERQTLTWQYRHENLVGYTILVENRRPQPVTVNHASLKAHQPAEGFYASSLSTLHLSSTEWIPAGGFGYLHLVYIKGERHGGL